MLVEIPAAAALAAWTGKDGCRGRSETRTPPLASLAPSSGRPGSGRNAEGAKLAENCPAAFQQDIPESGH
jgi:hypothetical protein